MVSGATASDPLDALPQFSVLSLFPPTFGTPQNISDQYDLERELDSLHCHLGTVALQSPKNLFDQAKAILESCSEPVNANVQGKMAVEENLEVAVAKDNENPKKRRLGLGLKRQRFSLKPESSQPAVSLEGAFDVDSYEDPDEFFAAYEKFEHAKKEIMKQSGIVAEDQGQRKSIEARPRRPGCLGRSYKHRFSDSTVLPPETIMEEYVAASNFTEKQATRTELNDDLGERDSPGSMKAEVKNTELLDELLSQNLEDLDADGAANFLKDRLQIKQINIENLDLPDLQDVRKDDMNALMGNLSKKRHVLADIQNLMKGARRHSPTKDSGPESSKSYLSSQSASKSPLFPISLLKKRLYKESLPIDPFCTTGVDEVAATSSPHTEHSGGQFDDVNKRNMSGSSSHHRDEPVSVAFDMEDIHVEISNGQLQRKIGYNNDLPMTECLNCSGTDLNGQAEKEAPEPAQLNADWDKFNNGEANKDDNFLGRQSDEVDKDNKSDTSSHHPGEAVGIASDRQDFDVEIHSNSKGNLPNEIRSCNADLPMTEGLDRSGTDLDGQAEKEDAEVQFNANMDEANTGEPNEDNDFLGPLVSSIVEEFAKDASSTSPAGVLGQQMEEASAASPNKQTVVKAHPSRRGRKGKESPVQRIATAPKNPVTIEHRPSERANGGVEGLIEEEMHDNEGPCPRNVRLKKESSSRRTSLADAGTLWTNGVRRSTRIRSRPLAYWKGERFLYGRIHQSLATVIGVKYESPGKADGKPGLKVKSFVSDEYKELVDLVS